jgi:hypothetical protein
VDKARLLSALFTLELMHMGEKQCYQRNIVA